MDKTENMLFISALQSLAKGMNIVTVAEGAESLEEAQILTECGIDHIQGYAFSMPTMERIWLPQEHDLRNPLAHIKTA
jgi:EAL domain-containing protein (putative c-di-GMP-specific phosphodiesterase class I)